MTYARFEDTPAWQAAARLAVEVYLLVEDPNFGKSGDLRNQLQRAALSVSNNIAEGFEQGSTAALIAYLYIARGSAGEVRSALRVSMELPWLNHLREVTAELVQKSEGVSRQLRGWADSLQNSDIKGQKHLNDETRQAYQAAKRAEAFMEKLEQIKRHKNERPEGQ